MSIIKRALLFVILPTLAILCYPPSMLGDGIAVILVVMAFFVTIGIIVWRGHSLALTFTIFLQGMNVIIRLMMLAARAINNAGVMDVSFIVFGTIGLALSLYLTLRLDKSDVRVLMTT